MDEEELAAFITRDALAWRIWMNGYEHGLAHGHQDERAGMEDLADLVARRQLVLEQCRDHVVAERANTLTMAEVRQSRDRTSIGNYLGGEVPWDKESHE
ncbi:hypothetical protein AOC05_17985 [Arthrobacter alpinus]|uniref:Uncharacterized protein n=1 Tax=Arthrobacter alpinus TaxID=656366 RepID=A0A0M4QSA8_9MICC|nr:hypothetical protein [Arthrobacter alpinus]ALE93778.1 hypothetical protein AOC05_17985 [Arthrobacter alpinus]